MGLRNTEQILAAEFDEHNNVSEKKLKKVHAHYQNIIRNIRPMVFREAVKFIKEHADAATKMLTKEHSSII